MPDHRYESGSTAGMIDTWRAIFARQRAFGEHAFDQLDDAGFFWTPADGLNSVAIIARHLAGNLLSRWTDFLTSDGEKPWRDRDAEFEPPEPTSASRRAIMDGWEKGWDTLDRALAGLTDADLRREITIRGAPHAVHAAIARQLDHYAFHVGQINVIARLHVGTAHWKWFTLPPGGTKAFNELVRAKHHA
ncbi:MAG: DUF1572 family protein [Phycisphaeraceae bacterium]|nr:MAG: DUF1572 family protein [Phycisphaeraceae bacterium]